MVKVPIETTPTPMDDEEKSNSNEPGPVETEATEVKKRSTRGRKPKPKPQAKSASVASTGSHRVFYLSDDLCKSAADQQLVLLRNPCTGEPSRYICQHEQNKYYELIKFGEPFRSWFVNEMLIIDGSIYITTIVDPLFLVLHYIQRECSKHFVPLENILIDPKFPDIQAFAGTLPTHQLLMVCDQKGSDDLMAVKYNESKTLKWLTFKAKKLRIVLEEQKFYVVAGAKSATFIKSEKLQTEPDDGGLLAYAVGMIGEYISEELCEKLLIHLGLESLKPKAHKRKSSAEAVSSIKRIKSLTDVDDNGAEEKFVPTTPIPKAVEKKQSAKEKAMVKAATGSKSIMSFFKKN